MMKLCLLVYRQWISCLISFGDHTSKHFVIPDEKRLLKWQASYVTTDNHFCMLNFSVWKSEAENSDSLNRFWRFVSFLADVGIRTKTLFMYCQCRSLHEGVFKRNRCRWISAGFLERKILKLFGCFEQIYWLVLIHWFWCFIDWLSASKIWKPAKVSVSPKTRCSSHFWRPPRTIVLLPVLVQGIFHSLCPFTDVLCHAR